MKVFIATVKRIPIVTHVEFMNFGLTVNGKAHVVPICPLFIDYHVYWFLSIGNVSSGYVGTLWQ